MKQTVKLFVALLASLFVSVSVFAQVTTSSFSGKVTDSQGAPVAGATIVATHTASGSQYYTVADVNGNFRILNVRPGGPYQISVDMLGFAPWKMSNVEVALADNFVLPVSLSEDSLNLTESILVADASTSNMRSDRAGAITSVTSKQMAALPASNRSMNDIMRLTPQATVTSNGLAVGGGNYRSSNVTVDGASFNNVFGIGSNLPAGGSPISLDALEQISVSITPYDVRQSGFTGGAIQTTTKSGTNEYHISVYDYYTSDKVTGAKVEDNKLTLSESLNNTIGINLGGPIIKNKLFYFVNFEYKPETEPGTSRLARENESQAWGNGTQYNRPTVAKMDEIRNYLKNNYNYDPGEYQKYSTPTPDWKVLARIDWNINDNHRFTARFSKTKNFYASNPSNSVSNLTTISGYSSNRNHSGRTSQNSLFFQNSQYFTEQNYTSIAGELSSRLFDGAASNIFRVTYSHQYEPRSWNGPCFPTVDIFDTVDFNGAENANGLTESEKSTAVYTSFGLDPFTYGNLRDASNLSITDEFTYSVGKHLLFAGLNYEHNKAINGYMQGGAGYYSFASWDDFVANKPNAMSVMYGNNDELAQAYPTIEYHQVALYAQDEMSLSDKFKLTAGLRLELPVYPDMSFNENLDYTEKMKDYGGYKTSDIPKASLNISPRVGFNWDVLGNRKVVVRGGTGIFTGRLPMVWLVSATGNSNVLQGRWGTTDAAMLEKIGFQTTVSDILKAIQEAGVSKDVLVNKNLSASNNGTILDKSLKMPMTWKSSLAVDVQLPWGIKGSLEGIYNKNLREIYVYNLAYKEGDGYTLPGEPQKRANWVKEDHKTTSYLLTNSPVTGYYYSLTASLSKDFKNGFSASAAYTHSSSKGVNDGVGDQVASAWNTMTYGVNGSNSAELGYGTYVSPNRVIVNASYRIDEGRGFATTLGAFYEGYNFGYVGSYSYTRYNYIMDSDHSGLGAAKVLMYIPTDQELASMPFADETNKAEFKSFLESEKYLAKHRGEYALRAAATMPWHNNINFKVAQDLAFKIGSRYHTIQIAADINNVANLLNPKWGVMKSLSSESVLSYKNDVYKFTKPTWSTVQSVASTWSALLSVRYVF